MIVFNGRHIYVSVYNEKDKRVQIALSASSTHTQATLYIEPEDWPAVRDAVDKALAEKAEK